MLLLRLLTGFLLFSASFLHCEANANNDWTFVGRQQQQQQKKHQKTSFSTSQYNEQNHWHSGSISTHANTIKHPQPQPTKGWPQPLSLAQRAPTNHQQHQQQFRPGWQEGGAFEAKAAAGNAPPAFSYLTALNIKDNNANRITNQNNANDNAQRTRTATLTLTATAKRPRAETFDQNKQKAVPKFVRDPMLPKHMVELEKAELCPGGNADATAVALCAHFERFGWPMEDPLLWNGDFLISYNQRTRLANWVLERITPQSVVHNRQGVDRQAKFHTEEKLDKMFAATEREDYAQLYRTKFNSFPMNHGHLAPAMNHWTDQHKMYATFSLANVAPQSTLLNSGAWNWIERRARQIVQNGLNEYYAAHFPSNQQEQQPELYRLPREKGPMCMRACNSAYVYTGPLFLPATASANSGAAAHVEYQTIGEHNVAIPTHFFKVLLIQTEDGVRVESYVLPNRPMEKHELLANIHLYKRRFQEASINFALIPNLPAMLQRGGQMGGKDTTIWGAQWPTSINEFWLAYGRPADHKRQMLAADGNGNSSIMYSCNRHWNFATWKLELLNSSSASLANGTIGRTTKTTTTRGQRDNEFAGGNTDSGPFGKRASVSPPAFVPPNCSPQMDWGDIGSQLDMEMRKYGKTTGAEIFAYSGPLFPPSNGHVNVKVHKMPSATTTGTNWHYVAQPDQFFQLYIVRHGGNDGTEEVRAYMFKRNDNQRFNNGGGAGLSRFERFKSSLQEIERISGIQLRKRVTNEAAGEQEKEEYNDQAQGKYQRQQSEYYRGGISRRSTTNGWMDFEDGNHMDYNNGWKRGRH